MEIRGWSVDVAEVAEAEEVLDPGVLQGYATEIVKFTESPAGKFFRAIQLRMYNDKVEQLIDLLPLSPQMSMRDARDRGELLVIRTLLEPGLGLSGMLDLAAKDLRDAAENQTT